MKIRLFIVDDHEIFLEGLYLRLRDYTDEIELIGSAMNQVELEKYLEKGIMPDVLLLDYQLPDTNGIELAKYLKSQPSCVNLKIIMLSAFQSYTLRESKYDLIIEAIDTEIDGYIMKDSPVEEIVNAVRNVMQNECFYIGESIDIKKLSSQVISNRKQLNRLFRSYRKNLLSVRETEVLEKLAQGCSAKEIAGMLQVSEDSITNYKDTIKQKIEETFGIKLKNVVELVVWSIKNRIIEI